MSADVAELLFDTFVSGAGKAKEHYKPLVGFDECDKRLQRANEQHGFEQGLKLGLRLAAEAFCSREEA